MKRALHFKKRQWVMLLLFLAMLTLFLGHMAADALKIVESETQKMVIRIVGALFSVAALLVIGKVSVVAMAAGAVCALLFMLNGNSMIINLIYLLLFGSVVRHVDMRSLSLICFLTTAVGCVFHITGLAGGAFNAESVQVGERVRFAFGFANPNNLALVYCCLAVSAAFLYSQYQNRMCLAVVIACFLISFAFIALSDSRTNQVAMLILILWGATTKLTSTFPISKLTVSLLPTVCAAASILLAFAGPSMIFDEELSNRPSYFNQFIDKIGVVDVLVGWHNAIGMDVDNAYLIVISALGFPVFLGCIASLTTKVMKVPVILVPIVGVLLIMSVTESFLVRPELPVTAIFYGVLFSRRQQQVARTYRTIERGLYRAD